MAERTDPGPPKLVLAFLIYILCVLCVFVVAMR